MWQAEEQRSGELERRTARSGPMRGQDVQPPRCEGEQLKVSALLVTNLVVIIGYK